MKATYNVSLESENPGDILGVDVSIRLMAPVVNSPVRVGIAASAPDLEPIVKDSSITKTNG